jgi:16S rRNA (guanine527-N7)-methyltransferase
MQANQIGDALRHGLSELELGNADALAERLLAYLQLLEKWNRAYNLSAVRDPAQMVPRHVLDSLSVLPYLHGGRLLDIGSGAGLPGIPLALARPELAVVLLDSNGKKTRFLRQAVLELPLANVEVVEARADSYRPAVRFDTVISRAFSESEAFFALAEPLLRPGGRALAMKGRLDENEVAKIRAERGKLSVHALTVPGLPAARHLLELEPAGRSGVLGTHG